MKTDKDLGQENTRQQAIIKEKSSWELNIKHAEVQASTTTSSSSQSAVKAKICPSLFPFDHQYIWKQSIHLLPAKCSSTQTDNLVVQVPQ